MINFKLIRTQDNKKRLVEWEERGKKVIESEKVKERMCILQDNNKEINSNLRNSKC